MTLTKEQLAADEQNARELALEIHERFDNPLTGPRVLAKAAGILNAIVDVELNVESTAVTSAETLLLSYRAARRFFEHRYTRPSPMYVNPFHPDFRPHPIDGGALYACHLWCKLYGLWKEADWTNDPKDVERRIAVNKRPARKGD